MDELPDVDGMILGQVVITRVLTGDDIVDHVIAMSPEGEEMALAEALGMIELAKFTLVDCRTNDAE